MSTRLRAAYGRIERFWLNMILEEGEGYKIEFKESYYANIDKEIVAFANASGGRIFIGISDEGKIKGIEITNKLKSQIQDLANNCEPSVKIEIEEFKNFLIVHVFESVDKPHKCSSGFYNRIGPNSQKMNRNDIIEFVKAEGKIKFDEMICRKFEYDEHFDEKKLNKFLKIAGITKVMANESILKNLDVATVNKSKEVTFNNTGAMFFSKNLDAVYFHTTVTCALFKGRERHTVLDRRDFNEDIVSNVDYAMNFLKQYIPVRYKFTGDPQRIEIPEIPYEALREAVINAVVHRDYFQKGANVMVEIFDDRIQIISPGGLVKGLSVENFGEKSILRNPNIANLFQRIHYIEKMGTGISRMQNMMADAGLKPIQFDFSELFVSLIFYRPEFEEFIKETDKQDKSRPESRLESRLESLSKEFDSQLAAKILIFIEEKESGKKELSIKLRHKTVSGELHKQIKELLEAGFIEMTIPEKPNSRLQKYRLTEKGKQVLINKDKKD